MIAELLRLCADELDAAQPYVEAQGARGTARRMGELRDRARAALVAPGAPEFGGLPVAYSFVPSALSSQGTRRSRSPQAPVVVPTEVGDSAVDTTDLNQDTATLTETDNIARSSDLNLSKPVPMFCTNCGEPAPTGPTTTNERAHCPNCGGESWAGITELTTVEVKGNPPPLYSSAGSVEPADLNSTRSGGESTDGVTRRSADLNSAKQGEET